MHTAQLKQSQDFSFLCYQQSFPGGHFFPCYLDLLLCHHVSVYLFGEYSLPRSTWKYVSTVGSSLQKDNRKRPLREKGGEVKEKKIRKNTRGRRGVRQRGEGHQWFIAVKRFLFYLWSAPSDLSSLDSLFGTLWATKAGGCQWLRVTREKVNLPKLPKSFLKTHVQNMCCKCFPGITLFWQEENIHPRCSFTS